MEIFTMKKVFLFLIIGLVCTIGMTSCDNGYGKDPGDVSLTEIKSNRESIRENIRTGPVEVTVSLDPVPANATDVDFKWESQDPSVATAGPGANLGEGKVTILKIGSTVVTVRSGQVSKEIQVEGYIHVEPLIGIRWSVVINNESITLSPLVLPVGSTVNVLALPDPVNANTLESDNLTLVWESDNANVAKVDQTGKITVTGKGTATITISCVEYKDISTEIVVEGVEE